MDIEKAWEHALRKTEIIRSRVRPLLATEATRVPYILLSESTINDGDTVVRKGEVIVEKPALIIPPNNPQFNGFEFGEDQSVDQNSLVNFLLVRGVSIPSLKYDNKTSFLDVYEGKLSKAIKDHKDDLLKAENVSTGLLACPEDVWQFSLLIFICSQIARNADMDIKRLIDEYRTKEQ